MSFCKSEIVRVNFRTSFIAKGQTPFMRPSEKSATCHSLAGLPIESLLVTGTFQEKSLLQTTRTQHPNALVRVFALGSLIRNNRRTVPVRFNQYDVLQANRQAEVRY